MSESCDVRLALATLLLTACGTSDTRQDADSTSSQGYSAEIRWTQYGIPHVKADNWKGLGFGFGYAVASNGVCVLAEEYATVKGERSRYFGATDRNIDSDAFYLALLNDDKISDYLAAISKQSRDMDDGYARGYNHYLATHRDSLPARCRNQPWVKPIDARDLVRVTMGFNIRSGFGRVARAIGNAAPNTPQTASQTAALIDLESEAFGSNAIAIGKDLSATGRGLLLGNPHYPWQGGSQQLALADSSTAST